MDDLVFHCFSSVKLEISFSIVEFFLFVLSVLEYLHPFSNFNAFGLSGIGVNPDPFIDLLKKFHVLLFIQRVHFEFFFAADFLADFIRIVTLLMSGGKSLL